MICLQGKNKGIGTAERFYEVKHASKLEAKLTQTIKVLDVYRENQEKIVFKTTINVFRHLFN